MAGWKGPDDGTYWKNKEAIDRINLSFYDDEITEEERN